MNYTIYDAHKDIFVIEFDKEFPTKERDKFIIDAYKFNGRTVGRKFFFKSDRDRSKFLTLTLLKR